MTSRARLGRRSLLVGGSAAAASLLGCRSRRAAGGRQVATFWYSYGGHNRKTLEGLVDEFNASQQRYFVAPVFQGDYYESLAKLRVAMAAGVVPTISHVIGEVIPYLAEAGTLAPLDAYADATDLDLVPSLAQEGTWVGGGRHPLVALPFNRSTPIAYVNADVFRREGLSPPTTWDELRHVARALTTPDRFGFECPITWWFWVAMMGQAGGRVIEEDGRISLGGAAGERAVEFLQRLIHEDHSMKLPRGRDANAWEITNQDFLAGRVPMIWTSTAFLKYLEANATFEVLATPLPKGVRRSVPTGGTFFVMMKRAPEAEQEAGWAFLRWMMRPKQTLYWADQTGYLPVCNAGVTQLDTSGYYARHPNARVAFDQLEVAEAWPWSPDLFRIQREVLQPRLEEAILLGTDAHAVMNEARELAQLG